MNRYQLRDNTFKLLFILEFYGIDKIDEQSENYFEMLKCDYTENNKVYDISDEEYEEIIGNVKKIYDNLEDIDSNINKALTGWKISRLGLVERNILRLAYYEINIDKSVPKKVAANEAVELGKKYSDSGAFINAILGKFIDDESI